MNTLFPCVLNCILLILAETLLSPCLYVDNGSLDPQCHNLTTPSFEPLKSF